MGFSPPGHLPDPGIEPGSPGLPRPLPADLPDPGIEAQSPELRADSLPSEPPDRPLEIMNTCYHAFVKTLYNAE